ncbi:hypothetical protein GCM10027341_22290 [Spirosoma knui]
MRFVRLAFFITYSSLLFAACQSSSSSETTSAPALPQPTQLTGQQLSQTYCGNCHLAPDPSLLDKATWQHGVLPQMALRMGQSNQQVSVLGNFTDTGEMTRIIEANIFPERPTLHDSDWQKIVSYYVEKAPDKLPAQAAHEGVRTGLPLFQARQSNRAINGMVTLLRYDSLAGRIWAGDANAHLYALNPKLERIDSVSLDSPATDLYTHQDGRIDVLSVGVLNPNDKQAGSWDRLTPASKTPAPQIKQLQRPVNATPADLNRDGQEDVVICQFGNYLGKLSWFEKTPQGYTEHILDSVPGARVALVRDVNNDQWPDVVALLTQGDEQIAVYYNQRNGSFRKETVLRFPSVYGSSYFELTDIDNDGDQDIVYANGDNADYSIVLKPYHGIRIFLNDGRFRFKQAWFYPMYGATQTVVRDFDQDGDYDIAAIAHFPDFAHRPNESFIYFENKGKLTFAPRTFPMADRGRWLRLEAGDVDQDGDEDILLGSFFRALNPKYMDLMVQWRKPGAGIMLLENKLK